MSLLCITLGNSSVAISAKSGTSLSLFSENYNIDFYFLIHFRRWVAVFCYLPSPCPCLPKWRSRLSKVKASQGLGNPQEESTVLLQGSSCQRELRREHQGFAFSLTFLQEPHAFQEWSHITLWDAPAYFTLMSPTNTALKTFLVTEYGSTMMWHTYEQNTGKTPGSYSENAGGKRESTEILIKWQNFCTFVLLEKAPSAASFQSAQQILSKHGNITLHQQFSIFILIWIFLIIFPGRYIQ